MQPKTSSAIGPYAISAWVLRIVFGDLDVRHALGLWLMVEEQPAHMTGCNWAEVHLSSGATPPKTHAFLPVF
jgi:hypothetical protein